MCMRLQSAHGSRWAPHSVTVPLQEWGKLVAGNQSENAYLVLGSDDWPQRESDLMLRLQTPQWVFHGHSNGFAIMHQTPGVAGDSEGLMEHRQQTLSPGTKRHKPQHLC